jgi:hypothetical protein
MLGELTELIVTFLNNLDPTELGEYKIPDFVQAEPCLDPQQLVSSTTTKLFVMPLITSFSPEEMTGRIQRVGVTANLQISLALLIPFSGFSRNDVSDWDEIKKVLELRELLDLRVIRNNWQPYLITDIDPQPPVEIELNQRNFLSVTDFTFTKRVC